MKRYINTIIYLGFFTLLVTSCIDNEPKAMKRYLSRDWTQVMFVSPTDERLSDIVDAELINKGSVLTRVHKDDVDPQLRFYNVINGVTIERKGDAVYISSMAG